VALSFKVKVVVGFAMAVVVVDFVLEEEVEEFVKVVEEGDLLVF
jgi:hypothetical protein